MGVLSASMDGKELSNLPHMVTHKEAHFAIYPNELIETPIKAGCPKYVCSQCGMPRVKIIETKHPNPRDDSTRTKHPKKISSMPLVPEKGWESIRRQVGWSSCACGAPFHGGIVLDPFFGIGTTGHVALDQAKRFIGIELSERYAKMAWKALKPRVEQRRLDAFTN